MYGIVRYVKFIPSEFFAIGHTRTFIGRIPAYAKSSRDKSSKIQPKEIEDKENFQGKQRSPSVPFEIAVFIKSSCSSSLQTAVTKKA